MSFYLEKAETTIANIQNNNNVAGNLKSLRTFLNAEFKCKCQDIFITDNDNKKYFFGAHVFPTDDQLDEIASNIIRINENIKFNKCGSFIIELDSKLLYEFDFNPKEILAVILHEIGHKAFSTSAQTRAKILFSLKIIKFLPSSGLIFRIINPIKFILYTLILQTFESSFAYYNSIKSEFEADTFVIASGYSVYLNSILEKLQNNTMKIYNTNKRDKDEQSIIQWTFLNILNFSLRRNNIQKDLQRQLKGENSKYTKTVILKQLEKLKKSKGSFIKKASDNEIDNIKSESVKTFFEIYSRGMSYLELDELRIEIEKAEDFEDKIYIITRIHKDISDADEAIINIEKNEQPMFKSFKKGDLPALKSYKKELFNLLKQAKKLKIEKKDFTKTIINIDYPKGYEG